MYKQTGKMPEQLANQPKLDKELEYLISWYGEVKGSEPLTFTEIKNWAELTCVDLLPWEVSVIKTLDKIFWKYVNHE